MNGSALPTKRRRPPRTDFLSSPKKKAPPRKGRRFYMQPVKKLLILDAAGGDVHLVREGGHRLRGDKIRRVLRLDDGTPHGFAARLVERFEGDGIVEAAERTRLDFSDFIRNPQHGMMQFFHEQVQKALLAAVQDGIRLVDGDDRILVTVFIIRIMNGREAVINGVHAAIHYADYKYRDKD